MSKELVKDRVIRYLMEDLYVPEDMIDTDVALSEFEEGAEGVIDIMVNVKDSEDYYAPVMIIKCLDEETPLQGEEAQEAVAFLEDVDNITTEANTSSYLAIIHPVNVPEIIRISSQGNLFLTSLKALVSK